MRSRPQKADHDLEYLTVSIDNVNTVSGIHSRFVILVTCVAAMGGLLFGYDTAVISGVIGFVTAHFALNPMETGWAASCALAGCVLGSIMAGIVSDSAGRRAVLVISAVLFLVSAVGVAAAPNFSGFITFRILGGIGIGAASMASPLYIAEMAPKRWRGWLVGTNQFAIVSGMLLIYIVNYQIARLGSEHWNESTGWRWMVASGAIPALLLLTLLSLVPETPRYLAARGKHADALKVAQRIGGDLNGVKELLDIKREGARGITGFVFDRPTLRVTAIGLALATLQQVTGINVFLYYAPEIFKRLGKGTDAALLETIFIGAVNLIFTLVAMGMVDRVGRKPLLICGSIGMGMCLVATGLSLFQQTHGAWLLVFVLGYIAFFAVSVGPVTWIVLSEIFPIKIRGKALSIATVGLWTSNFVVSQTFPMLDGSKTFLPRLHHAFPFFLYAGFCLIESLFVWTQIPETKKRSLEEIAEFWSRQPD
jgi:MFS transporter, SP family, xylose:H+ symportor